MSFDYGYWPTARDIGLGAFDGSQAMQAEVARWRDFIVPQFQPSPCVLTNTAPIRAGQTRVVACSFPGGPTLMVTVRAPAVVTAARPVVVCLPAWGAEEPAATLFRDDGYITVHVRFMDWYQALMPLYLNNGYVPVWGIVADRIMDQVRTILPAHSGQVVVSSATGSLVAPHYVRWQSDVRAVVTNGVLLSLDWLRRNYRFTAWPNIWDYGPVNSFTPIYLTMAPIPVQWQMGTADAFFPSPAPLPPAPGFSGTGRGQTLDEVYGQFLVLQRAWDMLDGRCDLHIGAQGHLAVDYPAARAFVAAA